MKRKVAIRIVVVIACAACVNIAEAQWSSYQPQSQNRGGMTYYNNANGSSAGRATTMGNTTYFYNANGSSAGRATTVGNTTYLYNANGFSAGTATKIGK